MKRIVFCVPLIALALCVGPARAVSRYTTLTFTSGSVSAGSTLTSNQTISDDHINVYKVKVSTATTTSTAAIAFYKRDTFQAADLVYTTGNFSCAAAYVDPRERTSGVERNEGFVVPYEDLDASTELHIKLTNNDSSAKTFTVTIIYEPIGEGITTAAQTFSGVKTFSSALKAAAAFTGLSNVVNKNAATYTIETTDVSESARTIFTCAQDCTLTLPVATVGKTLMFVAPVAGTVDITITRVGGDVIVDTTGSAYTQIVMAATPATSVTLICIEAGYWTIVGSKGTVTPS